MGRAARLTGFAIATVAAIAAAGYFLLPLVVRAFVRGLEITVNACVWFAALLERGRRRMDDSLARSVARWEASLISPEAFAVAGGLVLVGALALYGLQRLLGSEEESSR